jgi:hypothetical protein
MSTQHTPGPWKVKAGSNAVLAGRKQICSHVNAASVLPVNIVQDYEIATANARLIAAAPDLLEALKDIVEFWDSIVPTDAVNQMHINARAAIAKATGEL